jgi:chemotaxis protein methyltransferase CheR
MPGTRPASVAAASDGTARHGSGDISDGQFQVVSHMMYEITGVNLTDGKKELVRARLAKLMRKGAWTAVTDYVAFVKTKGGQEELKRMVDALTTNKTDFFRESVHFDFLRSTVFPELATEKCPINIWSAGCSSGEEPYTLAMTARDVFGSQADQRVRILATDISDPVLAKARRGVYTRDNIDGIPPAQLKKYFTSSRDERGETVHRVAPELRSMVTIGRLNLMATWPMSGPLDIIMCRNVMIYFDRPTRTQLVEKFIGLIPEGGYLFVGHSESLNGIPHGLEYVQPAVYRK